MKIILFLKLFVLVGQFYQKGKIDLNFNYSVIVHTKQFLSLFSYIREMICLFALLQFCVKGSEKKLLQLNWSCWSALTSLRTCFVAGALSLSVSLCQYQITQRGAVLWQRKMN